MKATAPPYRGTFEGLVDIVDGRYFVATWMRFGEDMDIVAMLWRDPEESSFRFMIRLRTYVDRLAHGSADGRRPIFWDVPSGVTEEGAAKVVSSVMDRLSENLPLNGLVHEIIHRTDRAAVVMAALASEASMHVRSERVPHG